MLAVVKTHRTNLRIRGFIPPPVLRVLRTEYGRNLTVTADKDDKEILSVFETAEYNEFKSRVSPADYIRTYRENAGLSQCALAEKLDVPRAYVCDIEHGRRAISKKLAKALAELFKVSVARFI
jgi:ribosome-binding protein aMBF1 (putative translation factor)